MLINLPAENSTYNRPRLLKGRVRLEPSLAFQKEWLRGSRNQPKYLMQTGVLPLFKMDQPKVHTKSLGFLKPFSSRIHLKMRWDTEKQEEEKQKPEVSDADVITEIPPFP